MKFPIRQISTNPSTQKQVLENLMWELRIKKILNRVYSFAIIHMQAKSVVLVLSQAKNIHKLRARTSGNLAISQTSSGILYSIASIQQAMRSDQSRGNDQSRFHYLWLQSDLNHYFVITLYQQQHSGSTKTYFPIFQRSQIVIIELFLNLFLASSLTFKLIC